MQQRTKVQPVAEHIPKMPLHQPRSYICIAGQARHARPIPTSERSGTLLALLAGSLTMGIGQIMDALAAGDRARAIALIDTKLRYD